MKRILSLFLVFVLILSTLASCNWFGGNDSETTTPTTNETDIKEAVKELEDMYKSAQGTALANGKELVSQLKLGKTVFSISWTSSDDRITVEVVDGFAVVNIPGDITENVNYTLTATITSPAGQTATYTLNVVLSASFGMITNPVAGVAYKLALKHGGEDGDPVVYFDGNNYNNYAWYFSYTTDILAAVDVYLEEVENVEGGYRLYFDKDGVKTYIVAFPRDGDTTKGTLKFDTEVPTEYWTYSTEYNTLVYTSVTGEQFFMGSSGTYKSISCSAISYVTNATNYPVRLFGVGGVDIELPEEELPTMPENYTSKDVVETLYKLQPGQTLEGPYEFTGVITSFKYAYDPAYNNVSVNIVVDGMTDKPVLCYRLNGGETLKVGDTITVFAGITNYNGTYETTSGGVIRNVVPGTGEDIGGGDDIGGGETAGSAVLDLTGNANLVSGSAAQNVFAANGITFTNDKASSTSDLTVQASYAQRAYAGSTIKIEYPGMTKIVITFDDYESNGKTYMAGFDGMTVAGATITRENDVLTIVFDVATDVFQSTTLTSQVRIEKIEVFTGEVEGGNGGNEGGGNEGGEGPVVTPTYTAPVAGQPYLLALVQTTLGKTLYFNGTINADGRMLTTDDKSTAVSIYFEEVTGGYHIYYFVDDVKTYIVDAPYINDSGYIKCRLAGVTETPSTVWTYDTTLGIIEISVTFEGKSDTFFAGTYSNYNTISLSGAYYRDQIASGTQFPARIEAAEGEVIPPSQGGDETHTHTFVDGVCDCGEQDPNYVPPSGGGDDEDDGLMTIPEVLASAEGTAVVVKGTVTSIYQAWSDQYNNISFYISDAAGNKLLVFRTGTNVSIGDQVTVTGKATLYNGTVQIAQGGVTVIDVKHVCTEFTTGSCVADTYCVVCGKVGTEATGHNYVDGTCTNCGAAEPTGDYLPGNLVFTSAANKADADSYMKTNFPEWTISGTLGQTYGGYLGFGRSGSTSSSITSPEFSTSTGFTVVTVLKGNGSSGVATSTVTFTLVDKDGNTIATGYADGSSTAAITPVDAKDTTYTISFTFVEGKTWSDATNLVVKFAKSTGNIGLKSLDFVK